MVVLNEATWDVGESSTWSGWFSVKTIALVNEWMEAKRNIKGVEEDGKKSVVIVLPERMSDEDPKALGV